jgi:type IV pilus assembly protein PilB
VSTTSPPHAPPKILGHLLVDTGRVTAAQVDEALQLQAGSGLRLGELLVRKGWVDAETVARLLAQQLGLDYAPPPLESESGAAALLDPEHARTSSVVPLQVESRRLRLAMSDPLDLDTVQDVAFRTGRRVEAVVVSPATLSAALDAAYGAELDRIAAGIDADEAGADTDALEEAAAAAPVVRLVDQILAGALEAGASDVHLEPEGDLLRVRHRIDGILRTTHELPSSVRNAVLSRLKIMAGMDISVRRRPQDGGFRMDHRSAPLSLRVSTLPVGRSEKAVVRVLDPTRVPGGLSSLGLSTGQKTRLEALLDAHQGVVLATGPTGSGKSSTLKAALGAVDRTRLNVVALEDPVEYRIPGVVHVQVAARAGLTFASALRAVLRQDPDVIMIGEIRDRETAEIAMAAAVTGHLVLSTLHTTDAPGAVARLLHMGVPPYLVAAGLAGVVAQRLVRVLCQPCRGAGCPACRDGFAGRTGIFQVMTLSERLRDAVATGAGAPTLRRLAREGGMGSLADDARRVVSEGRTLAHEAARVLKSDPAAGPPCRGCGGVVPGEAKACPWCGHPQGIWCRCGVRAQHGWRYCPVCARAMRRPDQGLDVAGADRTALSVGTGRSCTR